MKLQTIQKSAMIALSALALSLVACDKNAPVSPEKVDTSASKAVQNVNHASAKPQEALANGPIPNAQAQALKAPTRKVTRAEGELKIIKAFPATSLRKRFIASWLVYYYYGSWIYAGDNAHGKTWLYFPAYSLNQTSIITIDWESTGFLEGGVEFSPDGLQFNKPVTVWISYQDVDLGGINENDLRIWYWNEALNVWELVGDCVDTANKMVGGYLHHFSRYALGAE